MVSEPIDIASSPVLTVVLILVLVEDGLGAEGLVQGSEALEMS